MDHFSPESSFVRSWHSSLRFCSDSTAPTSIAAGDKEGGDVFVLHDGSWVAVVMEHPCCTGAGFNATVYVTSTGAAYLDPSSCYCGWLPRGEELAGHPKDSQKAFFAAVRGSGKTLRRL